MNGGRCIEQWGKYECQCQDKFAHYGDQCQISKLYRNKNNDHISVLFLLQFV